MRRRLLIAAILLALAALALPWDWPIHQQAARWATHLGGDVRRTLETLEQYGDFGTVVLTGVIIALLDPARRRRLWNLAAASLLTGLACLGLKIVFGRPRPLLGNPWGFVGPVGRYTLRDGQGLHSWELSARSVADLWSMPSSHTAAAVALSLFLVFHYPRLRPLAIAMVLVVCAGRLLTGAHYLSDLFAGATVGYLVADPIVRGGRGEIE